MVKISDFEINKKDKKDLIEKASICINGISLTISSVTKKGFQIWIIPHTFKLTNLSKIKKGDVVGFEPGSEYEFIVDNNKMYRVMKNFITIKYGHKRNEETYNPSWA